jgi:hypothetical protein
VRPGLAAFLEHFAPLSAAEMRSALRAATSTCATPACSSASTAEGQLDRARLAAQPHAGPDPRERVAGSISDGLIQRADLLEAVVADLYGPRTRWCATGTCPPSLVAASPEWLRPLVGVEPARGTSSLRRLRDRARPGGRWWVLGDRTQAPSGAGFALENRVATSRVFADLYRRANVHRLAGFFQAFRDALQGLRAGTTAGRPS